MDELEFPHGYLTLNKPTSVLCRRWHWRISCQCDEHGDTYTAAEAWARVTQHLALIHHIVPKT